MALRISSSSCLVASVEVDFGLGGGGTGVELTGCWGLTLKGRPCSKRYFMLHIVYCMYFTVPILIELYFSHFFTLWNCLVTHSYTGRPDVLTYIWQVMRATALKRFFPLSYRCHCLCESIFHSLLLTLASPFR